MTRWKDEFAKPKPFSPVHKARWEIEDKTTNEQNMRETGAIIENLVYYVDSAVDEEIKNPIPIKTTTTHTNEARATNLRSFQQS